MSAGVVQAGKPKQEKLKQDDDGDDEEEEAEDDSRPMFGANSRFVEVVYLKQVSCGVFPHLSSEIHLFLVRLLDEILPLYFLCSAR